MHARWYYVSIINCYRSCSKVLEPLVKRCFHIQLQGEEVTIVAFPTVSSTFSFLQITGIIMPFFNYFISVFHIGRYNDNIVRWIERKVNYHEAILFLFDTGIQQIGLFYHKLHIYQLN